MRRLEPEAEGLGIPGLGRLLTALGVLLFGAVVFIAVNLSKSGTPPSPGPSVESEPSPDAEPPAADVPPGVEASVPVAQAMPPATRAAAAPPASPPETTALDLAREKAHEALDPLIRPIAREADALDFKFRYYLETCRSDFTGAPPVGAGRFWFVVWISRAQVEWSDDRPEPGAAGQSEAPDCRGTWIDLFERARSVAGALERFEEAARANEVAPALLSEVLAAHRLTGWRECYFRPRPSGPTRRP